MRKIRRLTLVLWLLLLLPLSSPASGEDAPSGVRADTHTVSSETGDRGAGYLPYSEPAPFGSGGLFGAIVKAIFSLAIVIGLLYATLWGIRKFTGGGTGHFSEGAVGVVGRIYLSPKAVIYFLKLADELLVIGTNAGGISLLTTIKDEYAINQIENAIKSVHAQSPVLPFSRLFDKSMARFQKALEKENSVFDDQLRMLNEQIGRLRGLARKRRGDEE